jgi:hypothetical protein
VVLIALILKSGKVVEGRCAALTRRWRVAALWGPKRSHGAEPKLRIGTAYVYLLENPCGWRIRSMRQWAGSVYVGADLRLTRVPILGVTRMLGK